MNTQIMHIGTVNLGIENYRVYDIKEALTLKDLSNIRANLYPTQIVIETGSSVMPVAYIAVTTIPSPQEGRVQIQGIGFDSNNAAVRKTLVLRSGAAIKQEHPDITHLADERLYKVAG